VATTDREREPAGREALPGWRDVGMGCDEKVGDDEPSVRYPFSKANYVERRKRVACRRPTTEVESGSAPEKTDAV